MNAELCEQHGVAKGQMSGLCPKCVAELTELTEEEEQKPMRIRATLDSKKIVAAFEDGQTIQSLAEEHRSSWPTIRGILQEAGVYPRKGKPLTTAGGNGRRRAARPVSVAPGEPRGPLTIQLTPPVVEAIWRGMSFDQKVKLLARVDEQLAGGLNP